MLQRVRNASVSVQGKEVARIGPGLVALLALGKGDSLEDARYLVEKTANLRIFPDTEGKFNLSALDVGAALLLISQFTLYADTRKGRRPSFTAAAPPEEAAEMFNRTTDLFRQAGLSVKTGVFQEHMLVEIHNDGPVTIWLDSADRFRPRSDV